MSLSKTIFALLVAVALTAAGNVARPSRARAEDELNACGCRQGGSGTCYCEKKSHCGCPGECEPKGCEERRAKQMEKEIQEETRKAEDSNRRQRARQEGPDDSSDSAPATRDEPPPRDVTKPLPPTPRGRVVKMTPKQRRDLAHLLQLYLAEHPDQAGKALDQVASDVAGN